jgi:hypothetical protein
MKASLGPRVMAEVRPREPTPKVVAAGPRPIAPRAMPVTQETVMGTEPGKPPHPPSDMRKELMKLFRGL